MASICAASSTVSGISENSISSASVEKVTPKRDVSQTVSTSGCAAEKERSASPDRPQPVSVTLSAWEKSGIAAESAESSSCVSGVPVKSSAAASEGIVRPATVTSQVNATSGKSFTSASCSVNESVLSVSTSVCSLGRRSSAARSSSAAASRTITVSLSASRIFPPIAAGSVVCGAAACVGVSAASSPSLPARHIRNSPAAITRTAAIKIHIRAFFFMASSVFLSFFPGQGNLLFLIISAGREKVNFPPFSFYAV